MGIMFAQFFATITKIFSMFYGFASAGDHLGKWANDAAATFAEESAITRKARHVAMLKEHGITVEQLEEQASK